MDDSKLETQCLTPSASVLAEAVYSQEQPYDSYETMINNQPLMIGPVQHVNSSPTKALEQITMTEPASLTIPPFERVVRLSAVPSLQNAREKAIFNHYVHIVALALCRNRPGTFNPFLDLLVPVAHSSKVVMNALLALSGNHWKRIHPRVQEIGLLCRNKGSFKASTFRRSFYSR